MKLWMKVGLGIAAHWFFVYIPILIGLVLLAVFKASQHHGDAPPPGLFIGVALLVLVHLLSILVMLGTMGLFIAYAVKHPRFSSNERLLWILLLPFMGILAMPVFFWLFLFQHPIGEPFFGTPVAPSGNPA
jgi:hypothetical protein